MRKSFISFIALIGLLWGTANAQTYTFDSSDGLITDAEQFSANATQPDDGGGLPALIDGSPGTHFHTAYSSDYAVEADHYLQVHLNNALQKFFFTFTGRNGNCHDTWDDVDIYATNTPDDEASWTKVVELRDIIDGDPNAVDYTSKVIDLGASYTDVRFTVLNTTSKRTNSDVYNHQYWNLSEFQMYAAVEAADNKTLLTVLVDSINRLNLCVDIGTEPSYYKQEGAEIYMTAYSNAQNALDSGSASEDTYKTLADELRKALATLKENLIPISDGYYYIISTYSEYFNQQGVEKSMYAGVDGFLYWENHNPESPFHLFKITSLGDGTYSIYNVGTGQYINTIEGTSAGVPMSDEQITPQIINTFSGAHDFSIANTANEQHYHTNGHASGAGKSGNIVTYTGGSGTASAWVLKQVTDEEVIKELIASGPKQIAMTLVGNALASAKTTIQKAYDYQGLITKADDNDPENCQFSSNAKETAEGSYAALIDNNTSTFFHTFWSQAGPSTPHNLQVDLLTPQQGNLFFTYTPRQSANLDCPNNVDIYATNDENLGTDPESADENWTKITHLDSGFPTNKSTSYISPYITFDQPYRYFRMVVNGTVSNRKNSTTELNYFNMSEFQICTTTPLPSSEYYTVTGMKEAADNLNKLIEEAEQKLTAMNVEIADTTALYAAIREVNDLYIDRDALDTEFASVLAAAQTAYDNAMGSKLALITNANDDDPNCQLSSNAKTTKEGSYANLIDGDATTIFHTVWDTLEPGEGVYHNLQVDLKGNATNSFFYEFTSRGVGLHDTPNHFNIYATNNADLGTDAFSDDAEWTLIEEVNDETIENTNAYHYTSHVVNMDDTYRYIRFTVIGTTDSRMNDTSGVPFFNLGEFQMYTGVDPNRVQYNYNPDVKAAVDALKELIDKGEAKGRHEVWQADIDELNAALEKLQEVYADTTYMVELYNKYISYADKSVVSAENNGIGYVDSEESIEAFRTALTEARNGVNPVSPLKTEIDAAVTSMKEAFKTFMSHVGQLEPNKWYNIFGGSLRTYTQGQPVYLASTSTGDQLHIGGYPIDTADPTIDPYAIWRLVPIEGQEPTDDYAIGCYAIQSMGTGQYFGAYRGRGATLSPLMSHEKTPYNIYYYGNGKFKMQQVGVEDDFDCLKTDNTNFVVLNFPADGDEQQSFIFQPIAEDIDAVAITWYFDNSLNTMVVPWAVSDLSLINTGVKTYAVKSFTTSEEGSRLELKEKETFEAGEPFIIMVNDYTNCDNDTKQPVYFPLPENVTDTSAIVANGLVGTLEGMTVAAPGMGIFTYDSATTSWVLSATSANHFIDGRYAYLDPKKVVNEEGNADLVITTADQITAVKSFTVTKATEKVNVYSIDGKLIKRNVKATEAGKGLNKGIYIIGKKKISVK